MGGAGTLSAPVTELWQRHRGWLAVLALCLVSFFWVYDVWPNALWAPIHEGGDVRQACRLLKSALGPGSYYRVDQLGAPFVAEHYGFPETFVISWPYLWLMSFFSDNIYLIYNGWILLTFVTAGLAAYVALRALGCQRSVAVLTAWVYAYLPNHIERYDHYGVVFCATAPLVIYLALRLQQGQKLRPRHYALALLGGWCGPYPALFGCLTLLLGGVLGWRNQRRPYWLGQAVVLCGIVTGAFLLALVPGLRSQRPEEAVVPYRSPADMVEWSLPLTHLLLPAHARPSHPLHRLSSRYYARFPVPAQSEEAPYLGLIGLVAGLGLVLKMWRGHDQHPHLRHLAIAYFLLATTGGLGQLLSLALGTLIRCYNRISFHLAFVCLAALALQLSGSKPRWKLLALLAFLGIWEHKVSVPRRDPGACQASVASDREFVQALEARLPAGAMIWQYPYVTYPETPPAYQEGDYGMGRLYCVSHRLHWSWGPLKGNAQERAQSAFARLPLAAQLDILRQCGFSGLCLERRGYRDGAKDLEGQLQGLGLKQTLESPDHNLAFFLLESQTPASDPAKLFEQKVVEAAWGQGRVEFGKEGWGPFFLRAGWAEPEAVGAWSLQKRNWLVLPGIPGPARLRLELEPFIPPDQAQSLEIFQNGQSLGSWQWTERKPQTVEIAVSLPAVVELRVGHPTPPSLQGESDTRALGVMLQKMEKI